jgi:alpha-amylase
VRHNSNGGCHEAVASIHEQVRCKQEGLQRLLQLDARAPKSLIDHFWDDEVGLDAVAAGDAIERGDFADGPYETKIRRNADRVQIVLTRAGNAWGIPLVITKGVSLSAGDDALDIAYLIEGLPRDRALHFGVEFNFAGFPGGQDDRYFRTQDGRHLGHLGARLDQHHADHVILVDAWQDVEARLIWDFSGGLWTFPIYSVHQSEDGIEAVHQSVVVEPHWRIHGDAMGRWALRMQLRLGSIPAPTANLSLPAWATLSWVTT